MSLRITGVSNYTPSPGETVHLSGVGFGSSPEVRVSGIAQAVVSASDTDLAFTYDGKNRGRVSVQNSQTQETGYTTSVLRPQVDRSNPSQARGMGTRNVDPHNASFSQRASQAASVLTGAAYTAGGAFTASSVMGAGSGIGSAAGAVVGGATESIRAAAQVGEEIGSTILKGVSSAFGESSAHIGAMVSRWFQETMSGAMSISGHGGKIFSTLTAAGAGLASSPLRAGHDFATSVSGTYRDKWAENGKRTAEDLISGQYAQDRAHYYSNTHQGRSEFSRWKAKQQKQNPTQKLSNDEWQSQKIDEDEGKAARGVNRNSFGSLVMGGVSRLGGMVSGVVGMAGNLLGTVTGLLESTFSILVDGLKTVGAIGAAAFAALVGVLTDSFKSSYETAKAGLALANQTGIAFNKAFDAVSRLKDLGLNAGTLIGSSPASAMINKLRDSVVGNRSVADDAMGGVADIRAMQERSNGDPFQTMINRSLVGKDRWDEVSNNPMTTAAMGRVKGVQDAFGLDPAKMRQIASDFSELTGMVSAFSERTKGLFAEAVLPLLRTALPLLENYFVTNKDKIISGIQSIGKWIVGELPPMLLRFGALNLRVFSSIADVGGKAMNYLAQNAPKIGQFIDGAVVMFQKGLQTIFGLAKQFFGMAQGLAGSKAVQLAAAHPGATAGAAVVAATAGPGALKWGAKAGWGALKGAASRGAASGATSAAEGAATGAAETATSSAGTWLGPGMGFLPPTAATGAATTTGGGAALTTAATGTAEGAALTTAAGGAPEAGAVVGGLVGATETVAAGTALAALATAAAGAVAIFGGLAIVGNALYTSWSVFQTSLDKKKGDLSEKSGVKIQYDADKKQGRTDLSYDEYSKRLSDARTKDDDASWYENKGWDDDATKSSNEATALRNSVKSKSWADFQKAKSRGDMSAAAQIANQAGHPEWVSKSAPLTAAVPYTGTALGINPASVTPGSVTPGGMTPSLFGQGIDLQGIYHSNVQGFLTRNQGNIQAGADDLASMSSYADSKANSLDQAADDWASQVTDRLDKLIGYSAQTADATKKQVDGMSKVLATRNEKSASSVLDRFYAMSRV